jgi:hypothetical protein
MPAFVEVDERTTLSTQMEGDGRAGDPHQRVHGRGERGRSVAGGCRVDEAATGIHLDTAPPRRHRGKPGIR